MKFMVINGANLNFLGIREKDIYGTKSYEYLCNLIEEHYSNDNFSFLHSNHEGDIVDFIQKAYLENFDGIILNAGAYTHTSIAIHDAIKSVSHKIKTIEVHISNIYSREDFRHKSLISSACIGQISGFGFNSYILAIESFKLKYN